jgi:hypothetical protein
VRPDGGSCPVRSLRTDLLLSHKIGGCVCLILPSWIFLMGRHGVICSRYFSCVLWFFCGLVLTASPIPLFWPPRSLESFFFSYVVLDLTRLEFFICLFLARHRPVFVYVILPDNIIF